MNVVMITGTVADEPELRQTPTGKSVMNLRLKVVDRWKGGEATSYRTAVLWEFLAERMAGAKVGDTVFVSGRLADRKYTTREGVERWVTEIRANDVEILAFPSNAASSMSHAIPVESQEDGENIPF